MLLFKRDNQQYVNLEHATDIMFSSEDSARVIFSVRGESVFVEQSAVTGKEAVGRLRRFAEAMAAKTQSEVDTLINSLERS